MSIRSITVLALTALVAFAGPATVRGGNSGEESEGNPTGGQTVEVQSNYANVNGLKMYYEIHGTGRPLVLLHGSMGWATVYPILAKDRQVIAVEMQGHGHTGDIDRPLSYEQMAGDIAALLDQLKIDRADFFGYSMGGTVGLAIFLKSC